MKLFESYSIEKKDFPKYGYELNSRETQIMRNLVGIKFLNNYTIKKWDNYYYTNYYGYNIHYIRHCKRFDGFNEFKEYILIQYYISNESHDDLLELLRVTDLDLSFDDNYLIRISSEKGYAEVVKLLLKDPRVDPSAMDNYCIVWGSQKGHIEVVKLLSQDPRVDPSARDNYAIRLASAYNHKEVVKLLIKNPRVRAKLKEEKIKEYETS